jgi:hypothetical protein
MVENGKEVQYYPDPVYCVANNYPRPGVTNTGTRSPDSTYTADPKVGKSVANLAYIFGYSTSFDFDVGNKYGLSFSMEDAYLRKPFTLFHSLSIDYFYNGRYTDGYYFDEYAEKTYLIASASSFIFGTGMGVPIFSWFVAYAGGGLGFSLDAATQEDTIGFAWKVNGGLRFKVSDFFIKLDAAYVSILGPVFGIGVGLAL